MNVVKLLDEAESVLTQRYVAYGEPHAAMSAIAARWSVTLGAPITPNQVVLCMIDLKLSRLSHNPTHRDSVIDVIGYAALLPEVSQ